MKNRNLTYILWLIAIGIISCNSKGSRDIRPNIIYIMADDMGYADLSSFGRTDYQTPIIDALIRDGMRFTQVYAAAPVCTPTRVALMTGRFPARNEIGLREPLRLSEEDKLLGLAATTQPV